MVYTMVRTPRRWARRAATAGVALLLLSSCSGDADGTLALAKVDGWDTELEAQHTGHSTPVLEIAYDAETAQELWEAAVPDEVTEQGAEMALGAIGVRGGLDEIDHERQVVALWSSGQSGSCPEWVSGITSSNDQVRVLTEYDGSTCTDDDRPYRAVLVVDRDLLPEQDEIEEAHAVTREAGMREGGEEVELVDFADRE